MQLRRKLIQSKEENQCSQKKKINAIKSRKSLQSIIYVYMYVIQLQMVSSFLPGRFTTAVRSCGKKEDNQYNQKKKMNTISNTNTTIIQLNHKYIIRR